jgi:hypothetical protein
LAGLAPAQFASPGLATQALIRAGKPSYTAGTLYAIGLRFCKNSTDFEKNIDKLFYFVVFLTELEDYDMRKVIFIFVVILSCFACEKGQKPSNRDIPPKGNLDGFSDISWGDSVSTALTTLKGKNFSILFSHNDAIMANGKFAGSDGSVFLLFNDDGFYSASIDFDDKKYKFEYDELVEMIKEKYGDPNYVSDNKANSDIIFTKWNFENNCSITTVFNITVSLNYTNDAIWEEEQTKEKQNRINDL